MADAVVDAHTQEQGRLLRAFHFGQDRPKDEWSSTGPRSLSPFVPCASARIAAVFSAARLTREDVLWDLGCGDGRVLHQAAVQHGCRCVGLEIDRACVDEARLRAAEQGVAEQCRFAVADLMRLPTGAMASGVLDAAAADGPAAAAPPATVALLFITGHMLSRMSAWLHAEWSRGGLRIVTCVEALDECVDFEEGLFAGGGDERAFDWPVHRGHAHHGVFVVPPHGVTVGEWAAADAEWPPAPLLTPDQADATEPRVLRGLLSDDDIQALEALAARLDAQSAHSAHSAHSAAAGAAAGVAAGAAAGVAAGAAGAAGAADAAGGAAGGGGSEDVFAGFSLFGGEAAGEDAWAAAEEAWHADAQHRIVYLHRDDAFERSLPRLLARVLAAMRREDAEHWRLLVRRPHAVRSAELHYYQAGGSVTDPGHRDQGSLLTLSVLLSHPSECQGGVLTTAGTRCHELARGDGLCFVSEQRHNVSTVEAGVRRSFVLEIWGGPPNTRNRHS